MFNLSNSFQLICNQEISFKKIQEMIIHFTLSFRLLCLIKLPAGSLRTLDRTNALIQTESKFWINSWHSLSLFSIMLSTRFLNKSLKNCLLMIRILTSLSLSPLKWIKKMLLSRTKINITATLLLINCQSSKNRLLLES